MAKIFVDGEHGTTGLQIRERLANRQDLEILSIPHAERHNRDMRADFLNKADIAILCLPDDAAREAVSMINGKTRVIDTSTAHRTATDWVFGFAELAPGQREAIAKSSRVSNPGCYSTGAIALIAPLVQSGLLPADYPVTINAVSGYTGGGKQMIAEMEDDTNPDHIKQSHFLYALGLAHKHVPEIVSRTGLKRSPVFTPSVSRFPQGMLVQVPVHVDLLKDGTTARELHEALCGHYAGSEFVQVVDRQESINATRLFPEDFKGRDDMVLHVFENADGGQVNLVAMLDNLGKGASGAAVQNMDIMLQG